MEDVKIVAMIDRSAGNDSVGNMWTETKIFKSSDKIEDILKWSNGKDLDMEYWSTKENIKLSIAQ